MLLELFKEVFDENNRVKLCGREKCKKLIAECNRIDPENNYGNIETGMMDTEKIISLVKRLYN